MYRYSSFLYEAAPHERHLSLAKLEEHVTWSEKADTLIPSVPKGEEIRNHQWKNSRRRQQAEIFYLQIICKLTHLCHRIINTKMYHQWRRTHICRSGWHPEHIHPDTCPTQEEHGYHQYQRRTSVYYTRNSPYIYEPYVTAHFEWFKQLVIQFQNSIYGTMMASLLYWQNFSKSLKLEGY